MLRAGRGHWLVGIEGSGRRGFVQGLVSLLCGRNVCSIVHMESVEKCC
jgi:hypothetical protein